MPWRNAANCLVSYDLFSLLFYTTQGHLLRCGTTPSGLGLSTFKSLIREKKKRGVCEEAHRLAYRQSDRGNPTINVPSS